MIRKILPLILILSFYSSHIISQNDNWKPFQIESKVFSKKGNVIYVVDSTMSTENRENIISRTEEYISMDLTILGETGFDELIVIMFVKDRPEMYRLLGKRGTGLVQLKSKDTPYYSVACVYHLDHWTLNKELMSILATALWGVQENKNLVWLREGP